MARARKNADGNGYQPRLKERYEQELRPQLKDQLQVSSVMDVPRLRKITLNMGIGDAKTEAKVLENALDQLTTIAGQRAQVRRARKSIASFKLREGMPVGVRVTLHRPPDLDRAPADPRLPGPQHPLVRRARQLLARDPRADHLSGDQLRRCRHDPGPRRRDYHDCRGQRAGRSPAARPRHAVPGHG